MWQRASYGFDVRTGALRFPMRLFFVLFFLAMVGSAPAQLPPRGTQLILSVEGPTGVSVAAASIGIDRRYAELHIVAKSDSEGHFQIDLEPGSYDLSVGAPGFSSYHRPLEVGSVPVQRTKVALAIGSNSGPVVVVSSEIPMSDQHSTALVSTDFRPIEIKVVVITMFEVGADTGDIPGEYQFWVEREHLDTVLPFPQGYHDLRMNKDGVLGVLTGVGTARAAATIMALGHGSAVRSDTCLLSCRGNAGNRSADGFAGFSGLVGLYRRW